MTDPIEYAYGGALIRSALPLPALAAAHESGGTPIIDIVPSEYPLQGERVYEWPTWSGVFLERALDGWVYRLPAQRLAVGVDAAGERMRVEAAAEDRDDAADFLVRCVLPRVMDLHGRLLIHGATVAIGAGAGPDGGAIALIGRSRTGKSTLAAALCRSGSFQLMGDDSALLDRDRTGWQVHCSSRDGSLRADSAAVFGDGLERQAPVSRDHKVRSRGSATPVHGTRVLRAIYVLDTAPDIGIEPLSKYDAARYAIQNAVRFNPGDRGAEADRLARIHGLVQHVPAARLSYPRDYERLDDVCDTLRRAHA